eukprot:CAMPEP_0181324380 /NCGR_PEP_ID=MMETSP1101-20121128/20327_1 /TAXON_ID=46948 /ORGANISM="Rhodomonas abbreviata, Strain Caron Lab Isolate" /LENGTH=209 /DNA_ID=CAMNT_0023432549 /DNA_START=81 /DNA_END=707 /DNA_ORIENTATION=-
MYNGVGLRTVRGTATNGYVQKNMAFRPQATQIDYAKAGEAASQKSSIANREPNKEIMDHQNKRKMELKLMEFRLAMEDRGFDEDEIEEKLAEVRKKLENEELKLKEDSKPNLSNTHAIAAAKAKESAKMANALGIRDHEEGAAFNQELQAQRKAEKHAEWERKQEEREEEDRRREKERKEREKRKRKEEKERDRAYEERKRERERAKEQ